MWEATASPAALIGPGTEVVDLAGKMVLPGFQDGHVHLLAGGVELGECTLFTLESAAAIADSIRACAADRPDDPLGARVGWELTAFPEANPPGPCSTASSPTGPRSFDAADGHSAWANSKALELAGITREHARSRRRPDRARSRAPASRAGRSRESAIYLVSRLLPERTDSELAAGLERAQRLANESRHHLHPRGFCIRELSPRLRRPRIARASSRFASSRPLDAEPDSHRDRRPGPPAGRVARAATRTRAGPPHRREALPGRRDRIRHRRAARAVSRPQGRRRQADLLPAAARQPRRRARPRGMADPRARHRRPRDPHDAGCLRARETGQRPARRPPHHHPPPAHRPGRPSEIPGASAWSPTSSRSGPTATNTSPSSRSPRSARPRSRWLYPIGSVVEDRSGGVGRERLVGVVARAARRDPGGDHPPRPIR